MKEYLKNSKESELFRESKQQRRESSSRKSRTKKVNASLLAKESPIPLESSTRDYTKTVEKTTLSKKRVMTKEYLKSRLKNYKVQSAKLKAGKSPDGNGIRAEDIKDCNDETREMMRQIFNEVIKRNNFTPEEWKKVKIKVIYKKGDVEDVSNYRPICSLPSMYKLFSTIMYGRLYPMLDQYQAEDQAGFRKTYQTTDHLATYRMLEQKCQEWGIKMWTATVDFMKAFDSISHNSIWEALLSCNVEHGYVCLLKKLQRSEGISADRRRERNFRYPKRLQTGRSAVQPAVQHGAAICIKKRGTEMAKKKRNGYLLQRPRTRLPDELAIRR